MNEIPTIPPTYQNSDSSDHIPRGTNRLLCPSSLRRITITMVPLLLDVDSDHPKGEKKPVLRTMCFEEGSLGGAHKGFTRACPPTQRQLILPRASFGYDLISKLPSEFGPGDVIKSHLVARELDRFSRKFKLTLEPLKGTSSPLILVDNHVSGQTYDCLHIGVTAVCRPATGFELGTEHFDRATYHLTSLPIREVTPRLYRPLLHVWVSSLRFWQRSVLRHLGTASDRMIKDKFGRFFGDEMDRAIKLIRDW